MRRPIAGWAATALMCGFGAASLGFGAGAVHADLGPPDGPHHWCPGEQGAPAKEYGWDWNICHTYYWVPSNQGNVPIWGHLPSTLWDGDNPPAEEPRPPCPPSILPCL
jgi:hypothetical protein